MDLTTLQTTLNEWESTLLAWLTSPAFYIQCGLVAVSVILAFSIARLLSRASPALRGELGDSEPTPMRTGLAHLGAVLLPLLAVMLLGISIDIGDRITQQSWLIRTSQGIAALILLHVVIKRLVKKRMLRPIVQWTAVPIAVLYVFGWLDEVIAYLETIDVSIGNISFSAYGLARVVIFGSILFWLGRVSSHAGKTLIRKQDELDAGTRELFAKLFEAVLYMIVFVLLLNVMGVNLTALAVFGGALGVGLGFGLQSIASNFISGIILLLDRSLTVGDHIELEDGRSGVIVSMNMRSTTMETFDGKIIVVPNETFITTTFTNWTHNNQKQRYPINFQVAYGTDLEKLFDVVRKAVASHPQVLSGDDIPIEERPDAEIAGFGESGIDILVEFWMEGIDDGKNRVGADLLFMIWKALRENGIEIPFPQREVKILNPQPDPARTAQ